MRNETFCSVKLTWQVGRFVANARCLHGLKVRQSEDPFDEALAFLERAAPPSPLQAGAPAWQTPGLLRSPLHHQGRRSGNSSSACRSGPLRGRRSRPGQLHAGAPARRGLGGVEYSKDARGRFGGGIWRSISAQRMAPRRWTHILENAQCSPPARAWSTGPFAFQVLATARAPRPQRGDALAPALPPR